MKFVLWLRVKYMQWRVKRAFKKGLREGRSAKRFVSPDKLTRR